MNKIAQIQMTDKNVFSAQDLGVLWGYSDENKLFEIIKHYVRTNQIYKLARGLYSKKQYTGDDLRSDANLQYEIANKLVPNSYISLWTVLKREGVIFQYYDEVYSIAGRSVDRIVLGVNFVYKQIKESVLFNDLGITHDGKVRVASAERAIGDTKYLYPDVNLEKTDNLNNELLVKIGRIYAKSK